MPFGRPKKVGMKRAKKKKVAVAEPLEKNTSSSTVQEQLPPSPPKIMNKPRQPTSPGRLQLVQAGREHKAAAKLAKWAAEQQDRAETKYLKDLRIFRSALDRLERFERCMKRQCCV